MKKALVNLIAVLVLCVAAQAANIKTVPLYRIVFAGYVARTGTINVKVEITWRHFYTTNKAEHDGALKSLAKRATKASSAMFRRSSSPERRRSTAFTTITTGISIPSVKRKKTAS